MARYVPYDLNQTKMVPLAYADQILPGSFEFALSEIVENHLDLSLFEARYCNDDTGRHAYDPKLLLKIVLYGYYHYCQKLFHRTRFVQWVPDGRRIIANQSSSASG